MQDAGGLARFEREAKLLAALNHPNIAAIHALREEVERFLPDFDGDRAAREREYSARALAAGIEAFAAARAANLVLLRSLGAHDWERSGTQEGVGRLTLRDLPGMMLRHDRAHAAEIAALLGDE